MTGSDGTAPGIAHNWGLTRKRALIGATSLWANARTEYAQNPSKYKSLRHLILLYENSDPISKWRPCKLQISRDMRTPFGENWAKRHKSSSASNAFVVPKNALHLLAPCHKPIVLSKVMEHNILNALKLFKNQFGNSLITPVLIEALASNMV